MTKGARQLSPLPALVITSCVYTTELTELILKISGGIGNHFKTQGEMCSLLWLGQYCMPKLISHVSTGNPEDVGVQRV